MANVPIQKLARLSQLALSAQEEAMLAHDCQQMVAFIEDLQAVNTEGIPPLATVPNAMPLRTDTVHTHSTALVLSACQDSQEDFFTVPKVLNASPTPQR